MHVQWLKSQLGPAHINPKHTDVTMR